MVSNHVNNVKLGIGWQRKKHCQPNLWGLTTSRAFFVGDVNIFGMRLLIQIRYFFVNNRKTISLTGTLSTSPNLAKEGARSATIITRPSGSRFC